MAHFWIFAICILAVQQLSRANKRLEGRIDFVETRQDVESMRRRQDKSDVLNKLDILERQLNESVENPQCCDAAHHKRPQMISADGIGSKYSTKADFNRLMVAFSQEKMANSRWRREVPELKNTVEGVDTDLKNILNVVEDIRGEIIDKPLTIESKNRTKTLLWEKMDKSIQMIINAQATCKHNEQNIETVNIQLDAVKTIISGSVDTGRRNEKNIEILDEKLDKVKSMIADSADTSKRNEKTMQSLDVKLDTFKATIANSTDTDEQNVRTIEKTIQALDKRLETMEKESKLNFLMLNKRFETMMELIMPSSCLDLYSDGKRTNKIYNVYLRDRFKSIPVFCDMTTDGGGWTIFQRRKDGSEDFYRTWLEYEQGFGQLDGEFWLGNDQIRSLTDKCCHELRVDLEDFDGNTVYAKYDGFQVRPMTENYKLIVGKYSGTAGDSLSYHANQQFSTKDRDNDNSSGNCAASFSGAWWYKNCHASNLNGQYQKQAGTYTPSGLTWQYWKKNYYSMKKVEMKFR